MSKKVTTVFEKDGVSREFSIKQMLEGKHLGVCDEDVYRDGASVGMIYLPSAILIERFVREVAELSGQKVDWFYAAGRVVIKTTGDVAKVQRTIESLHGSISLY